VDYSCAIPDCAPSFRCDASLRHCTLDSVATADINRELRLRRMRRRSNASRAALENHFDKRTERRRIRGRLSSGERTRPRVQFPAVPPGNSVRRDAEHHTRDAYAPRRFRAANLCETFYARRSQRDRRRLTRWILTPQSAWRLQAVMHFES
jgi:hypothetical protein